MIQMIYQNVFYIISSLFIGNKMNQNMNLIYKIYIQMLLERGFDRKAEDYCQIIKSQIYIAILMLNISKLRLSLWLHYIKTKKVSVYIIKLHPIYYQKHGNG